MKVLLGPKFMETLPFLLCGFQDRSVMSTMRTAVSVFEFSSETHMHYCICLFTFTMTQHLGADMKILLPFIVLKYVNALEQLQTFFIII